MEPETLKHNISKGSDDKVVYRVHPTYGIWLTKESKWFGDLNNNLIYSDLIGVMKAQCKYLEQSGIVCQVMPIGDDGEPAGVGDEP